MSAQPDIDVAVVGAGVSGAAVALELSRRGRNVFVLERHPRPGLECSGHNSGVVHAGLYAPPGSLKARLCVEGNRRLYAFCAERGVPHRKTGKLVVAKDSAELGALEALEANARACGAQGVELLGPREVQAKVPGLAASGALHSRETGVVDGPALVAALLDAAGEKGATVLCGADVQRLDEASQGAVLRTTRGEVWARQVVNAAGLWAPALLQRSGLPARALHPWRGDYFRAPSLRGRFPHLLYPVKASGTVGLGVHLCLELDGGVVLGPDAEPLADVPSSLTRGLSPRPEKLAAFERAASRLLAPLPAGPLEYEGFGVRPRLRGPGEPPDADFELARGPNWLLTLWGIESPGLTAALALAEHVADALEA